MRNRLPGTLLCLILSLAVLAGCAPRNANPGEGGQAQRRKPDVNGTVNLMTGIQVEKTAVHPPDAGAADAAADFAVRLLQQSYRPDGNTLLSPLSILYALGMTANGARGDTLAQMEGALGLSTAQLNACLHAYAQGLSTGEGGELRLANAIWFKDDPAFSVQQAFLAANARWYGADLLQAPFDGRTLRAINAWVSDHTAGLIPEILDEIPGDALMYLVNALAFDAQWQTVYREDQVGQGVFTGEDGVGRSVEMMHSDESRFLQDGEATGFVKPYAGGRYAFVALLPNEGVSVGEYISGLTGPKLRGLLAAAQDTAVVATLPKFSYEYGIELKEPLMALGMRDAFDGERADLSGIGVHPNGNLVISRVLHKTRIDVDERGTRAGAATAVEIKCMSAPLEQKTVCLDRPFLYLLVDEQTGLPLFIGAAMEVGA